MSLSLFPFFRLFFLVVMFFFFGVRPRDVRTQQEGGGRAAVSQMFIHVVDFTWSPPGGDLAGGEIVVQNVWFLIRGPVQADAHCQS